MALVSIRGADQLGWLQPSWFGRTVEITSSDSLAAILRFQNWGRRCDATSADGMWRFESKGFFGKTVNITSLPGGAAVGTHASRFRGGILRLSEGDVYEWKALGFWSGEMAFLTPSGFPIETFSTKRFSLRNRGVVRIHREYTELAELPLLVMLGVHLTLAEQRSRRAV